MQQRERIYSARRRYPEFFNRAYKPSGLQVIESSRKRTRSETISKYAKHIVNFSLQKAGIPFVVLTKFDMVELVFRGSKIASGCAPEKKNASVQTEALECHCQLQQPQQPQHGTQAGEPWTPDQYLTGSATDGIHTFDNDNSEVSAEPDFGSLLSLDSSLAENGEDDLFQIADLITDTTAYPL